MPNPWDDNWLIVKPLGKGGQGQTSIVTAKSDPNLQRVLKRLKNNQSIQSRRRMQREVQSLQLLHESKCQVPAVIESNYQEHEDTSKQLYLVMEFIPGPTLGEYVKNKGVLRLDEAASIVLSLCETFRTAHGLQVLHRDLKPDNIVLRSTSPCEVSVIDYGLSFNGADDEDLTQTDESFQNRFLDLPETNTPDGDRRDPRSDLTAICAIMYFCLTGHSPRHLQSADGLPPHMRPNFSIRERLSSDSRIGQLELFFDRGFSVSLESRYQTIDELEHRLKEIVFRRTVEDVEDPVLVATRASQLLKASDRKTQLRSFMPIAENILDHLRKTIAKFRGQLGEFSVSCPTVAVNQGLPQEIDRVIQAQLCVQIKASQHKHEVLAVYSVGSRGNQLVLLRVALKRKGDVKRFEPDGDWVEVAWFTTGQSPDLSPAVNDAKGWINESIGILVERIAGRSN